jgi:hypothetical protein
MEAEFVPFGAINFLITQAEISMGLPDPSLF